MKHISLIIHTKHMYTLQGSGVGYEFGKTLAIDGSKIVAIGNSDDILSEYTAYKIIDATDKLVLPGFIDGHMHTGHGVLRGVAQDINNWMHEGMAPFETVRSSQAKTAGSELAIAEAVLNGTTTIGDDGSDMLGALQFIDKIGVRGNVSVRVRSALIKTYKDGELYVFDENYAKKTLDEALALFNQFHNKDGERIKIRFGPQGADFLDLELLEKVKRLAQERKTKIHMHLAQGIRESKQMLLRYQRRTIPMLDEMGYFDKDFIGIHLTDATDEEVQVVAKRNISMILCSNSIGLINGQVPPAVEFIKNAGVVGLGSDQAPGNNCHNMFAEMKSTAVFNKIKYSSSTIMPAWQTLRMATIDCAKALGIDSLTGSLEEGKSADIIFVDLNTPSMCPVYTTPMRNIIPNLVYSARGNEVNTVIANGKIIVENRVPLTFELQEILANAQGYADQIGVKAAKVFNEINGMNARYMKEGKL